MTGRFAAALLLVTGLAAGCTTAPSPAPDAFSCGSGKVVAQGSSAQAGAVNAWIKAYQVNCSAASVSYDSVGSGAGVQSFAGGTGDFAGSDSALSATNRPAADARCHGTALNLPMVVGPIALAYNVAGVADLRLAPATIAKIFGGRITIWNDSAIAQDNPGMALPATAIRTVHRSDSSGTTDNFTKFLAATGDWSFTGGSTWTAPGGIGAKGSNRVVAAIEQDDGAIGYVESSYARFHNLPTAEVKNADGAFVALSDSGAGLIVSDAKIVGTNGDLQLGIDYGQKVAGAYPIVLVTYEIVCKTGTSPVAKSFLAYASSPAGQAAATALGYAPLPESLRAKVAATIKTL